MKVTRVGILLHPILSYSIEKDLLSKDKRTALEYMEEEIASDPDRYRLEIEGVRYETSEDGQVSVAFRRTGPNDADLLSFSFLSDL